MITEIDALRFLHREAAWCRSRDEHEALCLLLPAFARAFNLVPMSDSEAEAFKGQLKQNLNQKKAAWMNAAKTK